jgi:DNA-binding NarL/FixJ family response regulator
MILIASAAAKVRKRWADALNKDFTVIEVTECAALKRRMTKSRPPVLVLDLALPHLGGVEGLSAIRRLSPSTIVLILSRFPNDLEAIRTLKAGAKGYCHRDISPSLLKKALVVVQKGEIWVERKVIPRLLEELTSATERWQKDSALQPDIPFDHLTPREKQVAQLVSEGSSNNEIASWLHISERTVKAHLTSIFRKLHISDRLRLALLTIKH